jgi:hypothetical protein
MSHAPSSTPLPAPDRTQRIGTDSLRTANEPERGDFGAGNGPNTPPPPIATNSGSSKPATSGGAPIAAWLATIGAALVLVAAVAATPGGWAGLAPAIKLAVLAAANVVVLSLTERLRRVVPVTAHVLGHLGPCLAVPTGVLGAASLNQSWPVAILAGGLLGAVATELQRRRLTLPLLRIGTTIALLVAVGGIAALTHVPAGVIAAALSLVLLLARRPLEAIGSAIVSMAAPVGALIGQAGAGPGTMVVLGLRGHALTWAAPTAGGVAGAVALYLAHKRKSVPLAIAAVSGMAVNTLVGLGALNARAAWWAVVPAALALLVEGLARGAEQDPFWKPVTGWAAEAVEVFALAIVVPAGAALAAISVLNHRLATDDRSTIALGFGLMMAAMFAAKSRTTHRIVAERLLTATAIAYAGLAAYTLHEAPLTIGIGAALTGLVGVAIHRERGQVFWYVGGVVATYTAFMVTGSSPARAYILLALVGSLVLTAAIEHVVAHAAIRAKHYLRIAGAAAAAVTPFVVDGFGGDVRVAVIGLILAACVATGLAFSAEAISFLDAIALAASASAFLAALGISEFGLASLAAIIVGGQVVLYGVARREVSLRTTGFVIAGLGVASMPFTTGAYDWLTRTLTPLGFTVADLNVTAIVIALAVAGIFVRRLTTSSSWLAYGAALAVAAVHLIATVAEGHEPARAGVAIGIGMIAVLIGAWRRLAAPLFVGTGLVVVPTIIMAGPSLAKLSMWLWVALGGVVLIAAAVVIERAVRSSDDAEGAAKRIWSALK